MLANTPAAYGTVAKSFHWLVALMILTMIPLGLVADALPYATNEQLARKAALFTVHKTLGVAVFFTALARIGWAVTQTRPAHLHPERRAETFLADTVHWLLYGALVLVPLSGWLHHAATTGFAPIAWPFGQSLPLVPRDEAVARVFGALHLAFVWTLAGAVGLHAAGALKHHLIDRDATLRRMWFGRTGAGAGARPAAASGRAPVSRRAAPLAALGVWGATMLAGLALGLAAPAAQRPAPASLAQVASDWAVRDGSLAITVEQFGNEVRGEFADWRAAIAFDPRASGRMGSVEASVAIGSLTLGSVTEQAMGPDFFAAATHPTATFAADIHRAGTGYEARGTLTLKGVQVPVTLPFTLRIDGDRAEMAGRTTLNRLDFGIGGSMPDERNLAFAVGVDIALTAVRGGAAPRTAAPAVPAPPPAGGDGS